jgi:hypothetical protein
VRLLHRSTSIDPARDLSAVPVDELQAELRRRGRDPWIVIRETEIRAERAEAVAGAAMLELRRLTESHGELIDGLADGSLRDGTEVIDRLSNLADERKLSIGPSA